MSERDWNESYASGNLPWDTGRPDDHLVAFVEGGGVQRGRALEIGCGTGTNAIWLAKQGFDVLGVDIATLAIEQARAKAQGARGCRFQAVDFLAQAVDGGPFDFVFDRGCFHTFDEPDERATFASRVEALLAPGGQWLSLIGSTEGGPRGMGPPRRSVRDIAAAIEPVLEITSLRGVAFEVTFDASPAAWACVARKRELPAAPSSRH